MFSDESNKLKNIYVSKNEINKSKKYKSLRGPTYFKIFFLFGPTTKIFLT